jgi:hypothetical protein
MVTFTFCAHHIFAYGQASPATTNYRRPPASTGCGEKLPRHAWLSATTTVRALEHHKLHRA